MIKRTYRECLKCSDSYYIKGYYNNGDLTIGGEKIKLGTEIAFVIDNTFYVFYIKLQIITLWKQSNTATGYESPAYAVKLKSIEFVSSESL